MRTFLVFIFLCFSLYASSVRSESVVVGPGLNVTIPDGTYDGTIASMRCVPLLFDGGGFVQKAELTIGIEHPWVGDLVIKVVSPKGTVITAMNRPGIRGSVDGADPPGERGNQAKIGKLYPIYFQDTNAYDPETMGETLTPDQYICKDDGRCKYFPNHGASPDRGTFASWTGEDATGTWKLCIGDAHEEDVGILDYAVLLLEFPLAPVIDLSVDSVKSSPSGLPGITMKQRPLQNITFSVSNLMGDATSIMCSFDRPPEFSVTDIIHVGKGFSPGGGFQPDQFEAVCSTTGLHYDCKYDSILGGRGQLFETTFVGVVAMMNVYAENQTLGEIDLEYEIECNPVLMFDEDPANNVESTIVVVDVRDEHVPLVPARSGKDRNDSDVLALGVGLGVASLLCCLATLAAVVLAVILGMKHRVQDPDSLLVN